MTKIIKKIYRCLIQRILSFILFAEKLLPIKKNIVFECESDMEDNPRAVYEYLIEQGYNKKHKIIWIVKNVDLCKKLNSKRNVIFLSRFDKTFRGKIKLNYYMSTSKWFIFSHPYWFHKEKNRQVVVHINHGSGFKNVDQNNIDISNTYDYLLVSSKQLTEIQSRAWKCTFDQMIFGGFPRIDLFNKGDKCEILTKLFDWHEGDKTIICMPTYKQSARVTDSDVNDRFSLSFVNDEQELCNLNVAMKSKKVHLIVKLHPLQRKDLLYMESLTNIHYITNDELFSKKILLYELIGKCDALVTDLSSVYTDYLYLNRPIAFLMDNIRNYKRGYLVNNIEDYMPGEQINNYDEFICFINDVLSGNDEYAEERERIFEFFHSSNTYNNCESFCKWLFSK